VEVSAMAHMQDRRGNTCSSAIRASTLANRSGVVCRIEVASLAGS
jgi:hypothetical protein